MGIVTKEVDEINFLYKVSVCIDNELEDKYIGVMGGDRPSICWNGDWEPDEVSYAKTALKSGRAMKLQVLKEDLPNSDEEDVETKVPMTTEENEDELLKSSIAMCEDALDDIDDEKKKLINELFKGNGNSILKTKKKSKASTPKKPGKGRPRKNGKVDENTITEKKTPTKRSSKNSKKAEANGDAAKEEGEADGKTLEDNGVENAGKAIVAGRIGGKRASPFGTLPKLPKK